MKEEWVQYDINIIPKDLYEVTSVIQDCNGTVIELEGEHFRMRIKFGFVDAIRVCDEGRRIRTYNEVDEIQIYRENFIGNPIFLVNNSEFNNWIIRESMGIYTDLKHYSIITMNDIVDIISSFPPEINISNLIAK